MEDEDDDIYAPDEGLGSYNTGVPNAHVNNEETAGHREIGGADEKSEDEEEEEEESDSDIDIITTRHDGGKSVPPPSVLRGNTVKSTPVRITLPADLAISRPPPNISVEAPSLPPAAVSKPGSAYPPFKTSKIEVDAKPIYVPNGKPITEIDMDADFPEDDKPWRKPGSDMTDFFNYGFDEFTWASYCLKQDSLRKEIVDQKKQMEDMQSFLGMPGAPPVQSMTGTSGGVPGSIVPTSGMPDMPPEMQQMMQQMMVQGIDPTQMQMPDFNTMAQMMGGGPVGIVGPSFSQPGQNQQQQQQQQMGYGYTQGNAGGQGNRNQGGRGQGRRW